MKNKTSNKLKVSIIIPAFNAQNWIDKCLDSIIHQSYQNIEVIAINDGSIDETLKIINNYKQKDSRIIVIDKENTGTYLTRKAGINRSTGDAIFNADADDFLEPNGIELMVAKMVETNADMIIGNNYQWQNGRRKIIKNKLPHQDGRIELVKSLLNNDIKGYIWGKLFKRNLLIDINYNFTNLLQEDILVNLHIFLKNKVKVALEPTPIYNYLVHKNSANNSKNPVFIENVYEFINITERILRESGCLREVSDEFKLFKCRNWIIYARLGGKLAKNRIFRNQFYKENYTTYTKANLFFYHKVEMHAYLYNHDFGHLITKSMKRIYNLIN